MPRTKPVYQWPICGGLPLETEKHTHRMKGKSGGKSFKTSSPPKGINAAAKIEAQLNDSRYKLNWHIEQRFGAMLRELEING